MARERFILVAGDDERAHPKIRAGGAAMAIRAADIAFSPFPCADL